MTRARDCTSWASTSERGVAQLVRKRFPATAWTPKDKSRASNARWGKAATGLAAWRGAGRAPNFLVGGLRGLLALGLLFAGGCRSAPAAKPSGVLWLNLSPPSATVIVDEQPLLARPGAVTLRISLRAGPHRLELRAPAYFPAYRDLDIPSAGERHLDLTLRPDPDADPPGAGPTRPLGQLPTAGPEVP